MAKVSWNFEMWVLLVGPLVWVTLADWLLGATAGTILRTLSSQSPFTKLNLIFKFLGEFIIFFFLKLSPRIWRPAFCLQMQMVVYYLPFSASLKKVSKGFLEWSLYSTSTVTSISLRQSSSLILPPGVASHFTALWTIIRSSPGTVHQRCRYLLFHEVHQTYCFLLGKCLLKLKSNLTDLYSYLQWKWGARSKQAVHCPMLAKLEMERRSPDLLRASIHTQLAKVKK